MKRFKLIRKKPVIFAKPLAVIINPAAGSGINLKGMMEHRFGDLDIQAQFFETRHYFHAYQIANSLDYTCYSSIIVVGGDGTISEAINGML